MSHNTLGALAVDIGNSAIKFSRFLPSPTRQSHRLELVDWVGRVVLSPNRFLDINRLEEVTRDLAPAPFCWYVASVNGRVESDLANWVSRYRPQDQYVMLTHDQFPLRIDVETPARVGTDRLAAAVAANELRSPTCGAIVVDAGTAVTVDALSEDGVFHGGAIFPGIHTAAVALSANTEALPSVEDIDLATMPHPIGRSTVEAIRSGIVWGCVGALKELISQMSGHVKGPPDVFCTGGAGPHLAPFLGNPFLGNPFLGNPALGKHVKVDPHLVLRGIALTGRSLIHFD